MNRPAVLALVLLGGCSGLPVTQDYDANVDFGALKDYAWGPAVTPPRDNRADNSLIRSRVQAAADAVLAEKGFKKTAGGAPDFVVNYHYLVERGEDADRLQNQVGVGVGVGSGGTFGGIGVGLGSRRDVDEYETLAIDASNPRDGNLIWHGFTRRRLTYRSGPEESKADLAAMTRAVLSKFPPEKKR